MTCVYMFLMRVADWWEFPNRKLALDTTSATPVQRSAAAPGLSQQIERFRVHSPAILYTQPLAHI